MMMYNYRNMSNHLKSKWAKRPRGGNSTSQRFTF